MVTIRKQIFILIIFFLVINSTNANGISPKKIYRRGIMDNINNGLKYAGQILGIRTASDVANLVSKAFSATPKATHKQDYQPPLLTNEQPSIENVFNPTGFISGLLRLMGFDSGKLGALAINGIIFIAQLIGNTLIGRRQPQPIFEPNNQKEQFKNGKPEALNEIDYTNGRNAREGSPIDWVLQNTSEELQKLLHDIQDKKLPEYLAETIEKLEKEKGEGDCVKQLLCKSAPFVWGMQQSVLERLRNETQSDYEETSTNRLSIFFKHLPDVEAFKQHGYLCEEKYSKCITSEFS